MRRVWRLWLLGLFLTFLALSQVEASASQVYVLRVKGTINPVLTGYIKRGLDEAEKEQAAALIIELDTPGGLDSAMRDIVQSILASRVPVVVYVAPLGARAASAGTFIAMAAHVAAMAPNTTMGAAHPVFVGPSGPQGTTTTIEEKAVNDAVAYIKSLATQHQRNADWAEKAVRQSVAITEREALDLKVIDVMAGDLPELLAKLDGREVKLASGPVVLRTTGLTIHYFNMNFLEDFLFTISNPNVAYILLTLAMTGLFLELANPGAILPGVVGGMALLLALYALGMLPVNYTGVLLIGLAFIFFLAELFVTSHGALTVGGVASLAVGSFLLLSGQAPYFSISPYLIIGVVLGVTAFFVFVVGAVVRAHRRPVTIGLESLVGRTTVARTDLDPEGQVFLEGERWLAYSKSGPVKAGEEVVVTKVEGLRLTVSKQQKEN